MIDLKTLFDFQRFEKNSNLEKIIQDTQSRLPSALSEDDLAYVNAAGAPEIIGLLGGDGSDDDPWWKTNLAKDRGE